jgi:hypothetical protein
MTILSVRATRRRNEIELKTDLEFRLGIPYLTVMKILDIFTTEFGAINNNADWSTLLLNDQTCLLIFALVVVEWSVFMVLI